jgi:hypothetical protein
MKMHLRDAPPNPLAYNRQLPVGLYVVLVRALAKLPENRYPSAMKFSEAIDAALGLPVQPDVSGDDDWLYDDIRPVSPDGPAAWTIVTGQAPAAAPAPDIPALIDPFAFDASADYDGPIDPFADLEIEPVVAGFSDPAFDDQFDLDPLFDSVDLVEDFSDEADLQPVDPFPPPALVLGPMGGSAAASPVIRPLGAEPPTREPARTTPDRLNALLIGIAAALLTGAVALLVYALTRDTAEPMTTPFHSDLLGIGFDYPGMWYAVAGDLVVLSPTPVPTVLLSDRAVVPGSDYTYAHIVIAVQDIDPVEVYSVPPGCSGQIVDGPAPTFACMATRRFITPVHQPFDTPRYAGGVHLPGTLPPTRASMPAVLLPTGRAQWLALVIVHWDGTDGAQDRLWRIARSVHPL